MFKPDPGTLVTREDGSMEDVVVTGITHDRGQAKVSILRVPERPGIAAQVFGRLDAHHIVVDMIGVEKSLFLTNHASPFAVSLPRYFLVALRLGMIVLSTTSS